MGSAIQCSAMKYLVLLAVLVFSACADRDGIDDQYESFVNSFYNQMDKDEDGQVSDTQISNFLKRYDNKDSNPPLLNIFEEDYRDAQSGGSSAVQDFRISASYASAYFKLQDLVDFYDENPDTFCRLTPEDAYTAVLIGDDDFDEKLNDTEFREAYKRILRGASSALLYVNGRPSLGTGRYDDYWTFEDWQNLFVAVAGDGKSIMYPNDFRDFWVPEYGGQTQAREVFDIFDIEQSGSINSIEWDLAYLLLDWDGDELLAVEEMLWIDYLLNEGRGLKLGDASFVGTREDHINRMMGHRKRV